MGYFKHESVFQAVYLTWKPQYEWQFHNGFQLHAITGLGYSHIFPSQATFVQNDGIYEATTNLGKPGGIASIGLGVIQMRKEIKCLLTERKWHLDIAQWLVVLYLM